MFYPGTDFFCFVSLAIWDMLRSRNLLEILKRLIHHRPFGHVYYTFLELEVFSEWTTSVDFQGISLMTHNAHDPKSSVF